MGLRQYRKKRDFAKTPEPSGSRTTGAPAVDQGPFFVVHKHDATRLHYDFRLQMGDALKSWAVPKGPSLDPSQKRLAVRVEDHPLDYREFEGTIPDEEYGGGTVMIWDEGLVRYDLPGGPQAGMSDKEMAALVEARRPFAFALDGRKLGGLWRLVPFRGRPGEKADNWLLIKSRDDRATTEDILQSAPDSARSGRSLEQIAGGGKAGRGG